MFPPLLTASLTDPIVDLGQGPRGHHLPLNGDPLEQALKNAVGIR